MGAPERRAARGRLVLLIASAPVLLFLLLPSLIIVPMALTRGQLLQFPPEWISIKPFRDYLQDPNWMASTLLSAQVALLATAIAAVCGTAAAIGLHGRHFRGRGLVTGLIMSPIVVPVVVLALGHYLVFARLHLLGSALAIALAHGLLTTPYVFISVQTSLATQLDPALVRSARSLGARFGSVLRHVYWPAVRPGVAAGSLLAFAVSFDEVVLALFLQGPQTVTLPVRMFTAIQFELTPKIAAAASVFIALAVLGLLAQALGRRREARP